MIFIELELAIAPLSVNKLYCNIPGQARRFISTEGKKFKAAVNVSVRDTILRKNLVKDISEIPGKPLSVSMAVGLPSWFLKDGKTIRRKDIDNTAKATLDSVFATLAEYSEDIDDSQIWELRQSKFVSDAPLVKITIQEYYTQ